ncbi:MAG: DUF4152 family protein [Armatimonadota bacterium]
MRILAADSACSFLDESLMPTGILNTAVVLLDYPYREPLAVRAVPADYRLTDPNVLVYELRLCEHMLETESADCIHLDLSFGGANILSLTEEMLWRMPLSAAGREVLRLILPELQKIAMSIGEKHHIPVYAIGGKSVAVRLAELHAAAAGISRAAQRTLASESPLVVGLPRCSRAVFENGQVHVVSQDPMECGLSGHADVPSGISVEAFLNPVARDFQALRLSASA